MDGSRRVRATSVLPGYGPTCLFKGHLGTKSNAFCTDSSSLSLSTLQLVKNHMAVHYNKILSAKAVVDCSIPISVSTSIKYADQQRREKLKKELARYEKEFKAAVQANSKTNPKSFFNTIQKDPWKTFQAVPSLQRYSHTTCTGLALTPSGEPQDQDVLIEGVNGFPSFQKSLVPSSESQQLSLPKSDKIVVDGIENPGSSPCSADCTAFPPRKPSSRPKFCGRPRSTFPQSHRFQLVISKTPSRDLLDKHSELFSDKQLPFTPRTLKTEAKSFLSQYRYYTPAKRKKDFTDQRIEAETQTELSSFNSDFDTAETNNLTDSKVNPKQASNYMTYGTTEKTPLPLEGPGLPWQENKDGTLQQPSPRSVCPYTMQHPSESKICADDEELSYLNFMQDVTNEILKLGLFSNRFLERLFERHIEQNKHHLKEEKMRHLLHGLKVDLGCTSEESLVKPNAEQNELKNERDIIIRQERQEYRKALDMLLCAPKVENEVSFQTEFFIPRYKTKYSDKVIIQQVNEEPSRWGEDNPDISDSLLDQETSVYVIEGDSDTEKVETSNDLCCLSTLPTKSVLFSRVKGGNSHDRELPTLKIMKMSIEDCPSEV